MFIRSMENHITAGTSLQQDGSQISNSVNNETKINLHTIGLGELQILHRFVEVPVLLIQPYL